MWPDLFVLSEPYVDGDLGLLGGVEPLGVEDFATKCSVEALVVSVLPRTPWLDLNWVGAGLLEPGLPTDFPVRMALLARLMLPSVTSATNPRPRSGGIWLLMLSRSMRALEAYFIIACSVMYRSHRSAVVGLNFALAFTLEGSLHSAI